MHVFVKANLRQSKKKKGDSHNVSKKIPAEQCRWFKRNKSALSAVIPPELDF